MPGPLARQDRPFLGWGQLALPPLAVGLSFGSCGCFVSAFALVYCPFWAWKACDRIAEWRYTVRWEESLIIDESRPDPGYEGRLRGGLFALELIAMFALALLS